MQKTRKFMIAVMAAMMVFAFGAVNAFADEGHWTWNDDYSACTFTDTDGEIYVLVSILRGIPR